jgi:hypothetical protein
LFALISLALCVALSMAYAGRFDGCAAITVFPVWVWFASGFVPLALLLRKRGNRWILIAALAWMFFLLRFADEPWSLLRLAAHPPTASGETLRVVSVNANIGNRGILADLALYRPDIVLLQESPSRADVELIAKQLFGERGNSCTASMPR